MAILGTMLVSLVMAGAKMKRQSYSAVQRTEACAILDGLVNDWWADSPSVPRNSGGVVEDQPEWMWRTRSVRSVTIGTVAGEVVAVEVFDRSRQSETPAAHIELVLGTTTDEE
jgi:hypothetical protein